MDVQNDETGDAVSSPEDSFKISQTHRETDKRPNGRTTTPMTEDAVSALRLKIAPFKQQATQRWQCVP